MNDQALRTLLALIVAILGTIAPGCRSSATPEETVSHFIKGFNDNIPAVLAEVRGQVLSERTRHARDEQAARQRGSEEEAREAVRALDKIESKLRFLESLEPRLLHLEHDILEVEELEWPRGAMRVIARVHGQTLHTGEERLELRPIDEKQRDWVFTLTPDEDKGWIILDQRLEGMTPFEEELRANLRD